MKNNLGIIVFLYILNLLNTYWIFTHELHQLLILTLKKKFSFFYNFDNQVLVTKLDQKETEVCQMKLNWQYCIHQWFWEVNIHRVIGTHHLQCIGFKNVMHLSKALKAVAEVIEEEEEKVKQNV